MFDTSVIFGVITLGASAAVGAVGWVISVEKRINGLKYLHRRVEELGHGMGRVDRRTERIETLLTGRLAESDER